MRKLLPLALLLLLLSSCARRVALAPEKGLIRVAIAIDVAKVKVEGKLRVLCEGRGELKAERLAVFSGNSGYYYIQLGSFRIRKNAERLARSAGAEVVFRGSLYRVVLGKWKRRQKAEQRLNQIRSRFPDAFIVGSGKGGDIEVRMGDREIFCRRVRVLPDKGFVKVNGRSYRGQLEISPSPSGLLVVNLLPLEEYLRGVVPCEMPPDSYPSLEALKALAVAARTYALRRMGLYRERGYDICADSTCQLYCGAEAERPLSDRAVRETEGLVLVYKGEPIEALYSSSCGGRTEESSLIFPGRSYPYLIGVSCPEERSWWILTSSVSQLKLCRKLKEGKLNSIEGNAVIIEGKRLKLARPLVLFRKQRKRTERAGVLLLVEGQQVLFCISRNTVKALGWDYSDFNSAKPYWAVRMEREQLERKLAPLIGGKLLDIAPASRGSSGRVISLRVIGERAGAQVKGYRIKALLGLKDLWFVIDRVYDSRGRIRAFVFMGRGAGHGLGLCQEGAYLMALKGFDYRAILMHYYPGADIIKWSFGK